MNSNDSSMNNDVIDLCGDSSSDDDDDDDDVVIVKTIAAPRATAAARPVRPRPPPPPPPRPSRDHQLQQQQHRSSSSVVASNNNNSNNNNNKRQKRLSSPSSSSSSSSSLVKKNGGDVIELLSSSDEEDDDEEEASSNNKHRHRHRRQQQNNNSSSSSVKMTRPPPARLVSNLEEQVQQQQQRRRQEEEEEEKQPSSSTLAVVAAPITTSSNSNISIAAAAAADNNNTDDDSKEEEEKRKAEEDAESDYELARRLQKEEDHAHTGHRHHRRDDDKNANSVMNLVDCDYELARRRLQKEEDSARIRAAAVAAASASASSGRRKVYEGQQADADDSVTMKVKIRREPTTALATATATSGDSKKQTAVTAMAMATTAVTTLSNIAASTNTNTTQDDGNNNNNNNDRTSLFRGGKPTPLLKSSMKSKRKWSSLSSSPSSSSANNGSESTTGTSNTASSSSSAGGKWTKEEKEIFQQRLKDCSVVRTYSDSEMPRYDMKKMASFIPNKTNTQCAKRLQNFKLQLSRRQQKQQRLLAEKEKQHSQLLSERKRAPQTQHQQPSSSGAAAAAAAAGPSQQQRLLEPEKQRHCQLSEHKQAPEPKTHQHSSSTPSSSSSSSGPTPNNCRQSNPRTLSKTSSSLAAQQRRSGADHYVDDRKPAAVVESTIATNTTSKPVAAGSSRRMKYNRHTRQPSMKETSLGWRLKMLDDSNSPGRNRKESHVDLDQEHKKGIDADDDNDDDMSISSSDGEDEEEDRPGDDSIQRKDQTGNKIATESTQNESDRAGTSFRRVSTEIVTDNREDDDDHIHLSSSPSSSSSSSGAPDFDTPPESDDDMTFKGTESECDDHDFNYSPPNDTLNRDDVEGEATQNVGNDLEASSKTTKKTPTTLNVETTVAKKKKGTIVRSGGNSEAFSMSIQERVKKRRKELTTKPLQIQTPAATTEPLSTAVSNVADQSKSSTTKKKAKGSEYLGIVPGFPQESFDPETKMPVLRIAVYDDKNYDTVFKFCIRVAPSLIPGAGMGAHLRYEGAMRLKVTSMGHGHAEEARKQSAMEENFNETLEAVCPSGERLTIKLQGRVLEDCADMFQKPSIEDYDDVADMPFPDRLADKMIDLGCYGPLLSSDRKTNSQYSLKNFIFSNKPEEYGFGVVGPMVTFLPYYIEGDPEVEGQVLDITDDLTGLPHAEARKKIYMYINECGHTKRYHQNAICIPSKDGHSINYSFIARSMIKNEQVELLVDWTDSYEQSRERRGYGRNNLLGTTKNDDHLATRFLRNFGERLNMCHDVEGMGIWSLYNACDFISSIFSELILLADAFLSTGDAVLTVHQVMALRRIQWLAPFLSEQLDRIDDYLDKNRPDQPDKNQVLVAQCEKWIEDIESWNQWTALFEKIDSEPLLKDATDTNFAVLWDEIVEEICFGLRSKIVFPMDESTWCGVARSLIDRLCVIVARQECAKGNENHDKKLARAFLDAACVAANSILDETNRDDLAFDSADILKRYVLEKARLVKKLRSETKIYLVRVDEESLRPGHLPVGKSSNRIRFHKQWYLCRQVVFIVNAFAKRYMSDEGGKLLNEQICERFNITADAQKHLLDHDIKVIEEEEHYDLFKPTESKDRREERIEDEYSSEWNLEIWHAAAQVDANAERLIKQQTGQLGKTRKIKRSKRKGGTGSSGRSCSGSLIFWAIVHPVLEKFGWETEKGNRPQDFYLLPRGIRRGQGYQNRIDFFDSVPTCLHALEYDKRWKDIPEVKSIVERYKRIRHEWVNIVAKVQTWPTGGTKDEKIEWIRSLPDSIHGPPQDDASKSSDVSNVII